MTKSRASGGAVYVAASKPSKWLTLAPSVVALVATIGAGFLTFYATVRASDDRTAQGRQDFLRQQQQMTYSQFVEDVGTAGRLCNQLKFKFTNYQSYAAELSADTDALSSAIYQSRSDGQNIKLIAPLDTYVAARTVTANQSNRCGNLTSAYNSWAVQDYATMLTYVQAVDAPGAGVSDQVDDFMVLARRDLAAP